MPVIQAPESGKRKGQGMPVIQAPIRTPLEWELGGIRTELAAGFRRGLVAHVTFGRQPFKVQLKFGQYLSKDATARQAQMYLEASKER